MEQCSNCFEITEDIDSICSNCGSLLPQIMNEKPKRRAIDQVYAIFDFTLLVFLVLLFIDLQYGPMEGVLVAVGILRIIAIFLHNSVEDPYEEIVRFEKNQQNELTGMLKELT